MTDTINVLKKEIEKQNIKLGELEEKKKQLEELENQVKELPVIKANLDALTRTLSILQGENVETPAEAETTNLSLFPPTEGGRPLREGSSTYFAYTVLKEKNKFLAKDELFEAVKIKLPELKENSFWSGMYRLVREKKFFKNRSGNFGLIEWPTRLNR